jgi:ketosteroid isomerase-like protein
MRPIWLLALLALATLPSGERDRAALLAADRELARSKDVLSAFADDAAYLYPGARLVRGKTAIRALLDSAGAGGGDLTWTPAYADVSDDGTLGYTYGWTHSAHQQGKYLACWRHRDGGSWMVTAYTRTRLAPGTTPAPADAGVPARAVRGTADSRQLKSADSAFAALSVARGAQTAFLSFAASEAVLLGPPGAPMTHGREAIGAAFAEFPADAVLDWAPVTADVAGSGDLGCTVGEASISARNSYSKYLTVWKRQADGTWKFVADGGNARPAP